MIWSKTAHENKFLIKRLYTLLKYSQGVYNVY